MCEQWASPAMQRSGEQGACEGQHSTKIQKQSQAPPTDVTEPPRSVLSEVITASVLHVSVHKTSRDYNVSHSGALVSGTGLVLAHFLVGVWGVEPSRPLLLLTLGKRVLPEGRVTPVVIKGVKGCDGRRHLHVPSCP